MADLRVEAESLVVAAADLRHVADPVPKAESAFRLQRRHLGAFGALGSLMHAAEQVGKAMDDLADASAALRTEWDTESEIRADIGQAFTDLDTALAGDARPVASGHLRMTAAE